MCVLVFALTGEIIVRLGGALAVLQRSLPLQSHPSAVSPAEVDLLRKVFGNALDLLRTRVVEDRPRLFSLGSRAFTLGNCIYSSAPM